VRLKHANGRRRSIGFAVGTAHRRRAVRSCDLYGNTAHVIFRSVENGTTVRVTAERIGTNFGEASNFAPLLRIAPSRSVAGLAWLAPMVSVEDIERSDSVVRSCDH
jgi:hypothetical protein